MYLRHEVDSARDAYEQAFEKMLVLTGHPDLQARPDLLNAVQVLSESLRMYTGALRRMANFAGNQS